MKEILKERVRKVPSTYRILNPPSPEEVEAPGIFIYVILLNATAGGNPHPFYVGQVIDLKRRFNNHQILTWHATKFEREAQIWIAGKVSVEAASNAEFDLLRLLAAEGYWLANKNLSPQVTSSNPTTSGMLAKSRQDVEAYAAETVGERKALATWRAHWLSATQPTAPTSPLKGDTRVTRTNLVEAVGSMKERLRETTSNTKRWATYDLVMRLAREYSDLTRTASMSFSPEDISLLNNASLGGGFYLVWWPIAKKPKVPGTYAFKLRRAFIEGFPSRLENSREAQALEAEREAAAQSKRSTKSKAPSKE